MPTKLIIWAISLIGLAGLIVASYFKGYHNAETHYKAQLLDQANASILSLKHQNSVETIKSVTRMKQKESYDDQQRNNAVQVQHEVITVPIYGQCIVPSDGVRLINSAINAANTLVSSS